MCVKDASRRAAAQGCSQRAWEMGALGVGYRPSSSICSPNSCLLFRNKSGFCLKVLNIGCLYHERLSTDLEPGLAKGIMLLDRGDSRERSAHGAINGSPDKRIRYLRRETCGDSQEATQAVSKEIDRSRQGYSKHFLGHNHRALLVQLGLTLTT